MSSTKQSAAVETESALAAIEHDQGRRRAPRLSAEERRRMIIDEAAQLFSEKGFEATTRDLAERLGVRQALLYKYFPAKEALIAAVFESVFDRGWRKQSSTLLSDRTQTLEDRLITFYRRTAQATDSVRIRLFVRAALDGWPVAKRRGAALTGLIFEPLIGELRKQAGLAPFREKAMMRGERELAMMLHAAIVFFGIREHVYRMPMPADREAVVRLYIRTFLAGAAETLKDIHAGRAGASLAVPQLAPPVTSAGRPRRS
ncbi:TetR/AcrR family transcriptional regulator [Allomesorhizobium camelthorni]|uniref:TetR/AcrR family transcriptional regulator n=1 Tax=Allomesorhizobium camelthorni TaxID=475069 RepID=A0A6G4WJ89_9HYPH|nr:TetR/AcrR family transcriptional regulator [Mesorhizobium camelthorni]NGO54865.1 TetR/AcrR family transcriptional regulator [Mesorhizobium camelthorni]